MATADSCFQGSPAAEVVAVNELCKSSKEETEPIDGFYFCVEFILARLRTEGLGGPEVNDSRSFAEECSVDSICIIFHCWCVPSCDLHLTLDRQSSLLHKKLIAVWNLVIPW